MTSKCSLLIPENPFQLFTLTCFSWLDQVSSRAAMSVPVWSIPDLPHSLNFSHSTKCPSCHSQLYFHALSAWWHSYFFCSYWGYWAPVATAASPIVPVALHTDSSSLHTLCKFWPHVRMFWVKVVAQDWAYSEYSKGLNMLMGHPWWELLWRMFHHLILLWLLWTLGQEVEDPVVEEHAVPEFGD